MRRCLQQHKGLFCQLMPSCFGFYDSVCVCVSITDNKAKCTETLQSVYHCLRAICMTWLEAYISHHAVLICVG